MLSRVLPLLTTALACGACSEPVVRVFQPPEQSGIPRPVNSPVQVDRVTQVAIPEVDVLFVVDNSCSMDAEQVALGKNFPSFLSWFLGSGLDYHIGVVSTDMKDETHAGRLRDGLGTRWIQDDTKEPGLAFAQMVALGIDGDFLEKGRAAAYTAIELLADDYNKGFVRDDAGLHLTVVSDEDDASGESPISRSEFIAYLQNIRFGQRKVSFSSIVGPLAGCADIGEPGSDYMAVTAQVGGVVWPICEPKWTEVLDELGFIAVGLSREFFLSRRPVPDSIEVTLEANGGVDSTTPSKDWVYVPSRNSIEFAELVPEPLSVVQITYRVLAGASGDVPEGTDSPEP